jgi:hypothetical protein
VFGGACGERQASAAEALPEFDCNIERTGEIHMNTLGKYAAAVVLCGALVGSASAANYEGGRHERRERHNINQRQRNQQHRIGEGIENGSLNPREAARLERAEARFNRQEARLRQGGLSRRERARLENEQDRLSRRIYREKHDRQ